MRKRQEIELADRHLELLTEWEEIKAAGFRLLDKAARKVSRQLHKRMRVEVTAAAEREPLLEILRGEIGGRRSEALERTRQSPALSLPQFVQCCRDGADRLNATYVIPLSQAGRLANAPPRP